MLSRLRFRKPCGLLALVVLLGACAGGDEAGPDGAPPGGMRGRGPVPVVVAAAVEDRVTDRFTALGDARSNEAVDIVARISSVVIKVDFREGQQVAKGDLLIELDDSELVAQLAVARADLDKVTTQFERSRSLGKTQVVSESELDQLGADVRRAEADVRAVQARLDQTRIRAPIAGVIGLRRISPGDLVGTDTLITTLDDTSVIKLEFAVPEVLLGDIERGMEIRASTSVYPDSEFAGVITSLDSRVDPVSRAIAVVAEIPNTDNRLKPGMFMTVELQRSRDDVLLIPEQALAPRGGRQFVYVVTDGVAEEREVTLGLRQPGRVEITGGLAAGEQVVIEGVQKVRTGAAVIIQSAGAA